MSILVTGGCGFIGTNFIANWFRQTDEHIVNIDCMTYAANTACLHYPPHKNLTNLNVDITDSQTVREILHAHHPRAIVHFAAEIMKSNIWFTPVLLQFMVKMKIFRSRRRIELIIQ